MMSIKIIIYFGCLKCARHCKKIFILIVSFVRHHLCKFSQLHLIPVLHSLQAALHRCIPVASCLRAWL